MIKWLIITRIYLTIRIMPSEVCLSFILPKIGSSSPLEMSHLVVLKLFFIPLVLFLFTELSLWKWPSFYICDKQNKCQNQIFFSIFFWLLIIKLFSLFNRNFWSYLDSKKILKSLTSRLPWALSFYSKLELDSVIILHFFTSKATRSTWYLTLSVSFTLSISSYESSNFLQDS